jgi:hypothetical protein
VVIQLCAQALCLEEMTGHPVVSLLAAAAACPAQRGGF